MKRIVLFGTALALALSFSAFAKSSGTVTVATVADFNTLNPLVSEDATESEVIAGIFDNLFRQDDKGALIASMATEVPTKKNGGISKNDLTFTFHLKKGIKWQDGKPFTAKDVKFTYDAYMNEKIPVPSRDPFDKITKFELIDDFSIRMTLKEIAPAFLLAWAGGGILPAHVFEGLTGDKLAEALGKSGDFSRKPIGTGPFKLKEWKSGSYLMLEANTDYFGGDPGLEKVIWKVLPDSNTVVTQLKTGEVTMAGVQPKDFDQVKGLASLKVTKNARAAYLHITFNMKNEILADRNVRQALAYALPRDLIVDKVLEGIGSVSGSAISPVSWAYNKKVEGYYPLDVKKAKSLLEKDGWKVPKDSKDGFRYKNGKKLTFAITTNAGNKTRESIAQIAQQYWKEIGVDLVPNIIEWGNMSEKMEKFDFDALMSAWVTSSDPDLYTLFDSGQIPTAANGNEGQNYAQYVNADLDKLIKLSRSTTDQGERSKYLAKAQELLIKELPLLYVYNYKQVNASPADLENFRPSPFTNTNMWNIQDWKFKK